MDYPNCAGISPHTEASPRLAGTGTLFKVLGTFLSHQSPPSSTPVSFSKALRSGSQSSQLLMDSLMVNMGKVVLQASRGQRRTVQGEKSAEGLILLTLAKLEPELS